MRSFSWIKDSLIQIVFISFAVVLTVFIAQISLGEQYTEYYDGKLASKSEVLARNAASLFTENGDNQASHTIDSMSFILNVIFPSDSETDNIRYALFEADGKTIAANTDIDVALPDEALQNVYTCTESEYVRSFYPLDNKDFHGYTLMVQIDDTPFLEYGEELQQSLYSSLFRGCLMMSGGYLLFSAISNLKKKKKPTDNTDENDENGEEGHDTLPVEKMSPERRKESTARLIMQFVSMFGCTALALLTFWLYKNEILPLFIFVLFTSIAGLHFLRIVIWFLAWFSKRPITGYAAQTMQFFVFLVVFLSMYIYSISGGYTTQIESVKQDELRLSSVFAGLALSGNERIDKTLLERAQHMDFGEDNELFLVTRTGDDFSVYTADDNPHDVSEAADLFESAWGEQSSVTGVRGGYKYGVTVIADNDYNVSALAVIRQLDSILADEMQSKSLDFMLAMSATVFAFVFLFVEVNRLLETVNIPNVKRERKYKYAKSITSLMFFANVCKQYPAFFLILIVFNIYENNPISWLPRNLAIMLPIMTMVFMVSLGSHVFEVFIKTNPRKIMMLGCLAAIPGVLLMNFANTLPLLLLVLVLTYTGISMVVNKLWDFAAEIENSGYSEFSHTTKQTLSSEYMGAMAGAVIGAVMYDKLGMTTAFVLSAAVLVLLFILIRVLLPAGEKPLKHTHKAKNEYSFFRFITSKRILMYLFLLMMPFVFGEYFIDQYSPLYAESISLSPGAVSWTSLLMTLAIAYVGAPLLRVLTGRLNTTALCILSSMILATSLSLFALFPGMATLFAASALVGVSIGIGKNIINDEYSSYTETQKYKNSAVVYNFLHDSLFGQIGIAVFTVVHNLSPNGKYIIVMGGFTAIAAIIYLVGAKKHREGSQT